MIKDLEGTQNYIVSWIKNYAQKAGVNSLVVGLSGGIDSALVALLCKATGIPTYCVMMPCHSSPESTFRAANFASAFGLNNMLIDLEAAHSSIYGQAAFKNTLGLDFSSNGSTGALRSCLRAPTLSFVAHATNGIIVGTGNRSEDNLTRYFQKFGDGCVDISPISDLFKSEVRELFAFMAEMYITHNITLYKDSHEPFKKAWQDIYNAKPSADLWGPNSGQEDEKELGISYDEIEWADRQDMVYGLIKSDDKPQWSPNWHTYSARQKEVIAKMWQLEKVSRHKENASLPVCRIRQNKDLVV